MCDYIVDDDIIIFSLDYNKNLDINLISKYNKIIFSNCGLINDSFGSYMKYDLKNSNRSIFNQPVD